MDHFSFPPQMWLGPLGEARPLPAAFRACGRRQAPTGLERRRACLPFSRRPVSWHPHPTPRPLVEAPRPRAPMKGAVCSARGPGHPVAGADPRTARLPASGAESARPRAKPGVHRDQPDPRPREGPPMQAIVEPAASKRDVPASRPAEVLPSRGPRPLCPRRARTSRYPARTSATNWELTGAGNSRQAPGSVRSPPSLESPAGPPGPSLSGARLQSCFLFERFFVPCNR